MTTRCHVCINCRTVYTAARRKCTNVRCKAPKRFSRIETDEELAVRAQQDRDCEDLLQSLINGTADAVLARISVRQLGR
jgi:formate dehydrogenase maturation protein FdhE